MLLPKIPDFYSARPGGKPSDEEPRRDEGGQTEQSSKIQEGEKPKASSAPRKDLKGTDQTILRAPLDTPAAGAKDAASPGALKADTPKTAPLTPLDTGVKPSSPAGAGASVKPDTLRTPITTPAAAPQGTATPIQSVPPAATAPKVAPGQLDKPIQAPGQIKQLQTPPQATKPTRQ